ncbi:MAG: polyphosphate kinase 1 [Flavobacteriales bacterium]|jgi:polyphosphate kinase|tara:strand:+ start:13368 stop:15413 length:2046 start_codon:yes stop_codon:yes gene_type:complete
MNSIQNKFINREISWLEFNQRVLQEADDSTVPLIERIRFLGIFSNNLDEFYKVRYATVKRVAVSNNISKRIYKDRTANELLNEITIKAIDLQQKSFKILDQIIRLLENENIFFINENNLYEYQIKFAQEYFFEKVSPSLGVIVLNKFRKIPDFKENLSILMVNMELVDKTVQNGIIHIPKDLDRFVELPSKDSNRYIMMVDDLIRYHLNDIFKIFKPVSIQANMIKISRDAELDFDDDISKSFLDKIAQSVKERSSGDPVRFVYDSDIRIDSLKFLLNKMQIDDDTDSIIPGGKYHNRRDYMKFPSLGKSNLLYKPIKPLNIKGFKLGESTFNKLNERDYMLHTPFHKFSFIINFLMEASIDPKVKKISITIYRLSKLSKVASALINAAKNGKKVLVQIELQARFDESANIKYAKEMQFHGIKLIFGSPNLKVHSKICLIERVENKIIKKYGFISTGNFNESSAKIYTDLTLFTSNEKILNEISNVFIFFDANYKKYNFKNLIISPINTESRFKKLIKKEVQNAKLGKPAWIKIKLNNITSYSMIKALYEASRNGVRIQMIVRGICCLIPRQVGMSENIEVISIIDKFLEHTRFMIFCNNQDNEVFISSADWMTRNLDNRVEVTCPIYQPELKKELFDIFNIYWNDNIKSRYVNLEKINRYNRNDKPNSRSQEELYKYYLN